ncbi:MAG: hypothetical protein AAGC58_04795 [Asticcacaulis sp.]|uniref:hypothetical protein n=1 Tax=Asticcacaulis tiandongensis TaxID=2565365 RepID=UPI001FE60742|nr:hypothetical protein [Asticcacaulis tiandongensis]
MRFQMLNHMRGMELTLNTTLIWLSALAVTAAFSGYMGARPTSLKQTGPRMVPWRFIMLLAVTAAIVLLVHLLSLLGLKTDPPQGY